MSRTPPRAARKPAKPARRGPAARAPATRPDHDLAPPEDLLGPPALIGGEIAAAFEALQRDIARTIRPRDALEWLWVRDMTDLAWQARRLRRMRAATTARATGADWQAPSPEEMDVLMRKMLAREPCPELEAMALPDPGAFGEAARRALVELDRLILSLDARRDQIVVMIEARRRSAAAALAGEGVQ